MKNNIRLAIESNSKLRIFLMVLYDVALSCLAFYLAHFTIFYRITEDNSAFPLNYNTYVFFIAMFCVIINVTMLALTGNYKEVWKYANLLNFVKYIFSFILSAVIIIVFKLFIWWFADINFWVPVIILFLLYSALFSSVIRYFTAIINYFKYAKTTISKNSKGLKRTVVIGGGYTGSLLVDRFINNLHEGYLPVAIIDDNKDKQGGRICDVPIVCGLDRIDKVVKTYKPEIFVIAIMALTKSQLRKIYNACSVYKLPIKVAPHIADASLEIAANAISLSDINIESLLGRDEFTVNHELINKSIKDKVVLVTGGAGSIGSELCRQVLEFGCKHLIIYDQHENGMFFLNQEFTRKYDVSKYTLVIGSVRDVEKLKKTFSDFKPETVFHAAAYKHVPMMEISATEAVKNNVLGTLNVINCAEESGALNFVLISTDKAVNPSSIMGASKRIAEMLIETRGKNSKMNMAAVRFGNVLGSNGSVVPIFLEQIKNGEPITLTDRYIKRYFMSIPEAVKLVLQAGAFANNGEIFVLDMGEPVYIYDLACDLIRLCGLEPEKDIEIKITGLRPGEKMFEELRYDTEAVDTTSHNGILVNKMQEIDVDFFSKQLEELVKFTSDEDEQKTTEVIFKIVPDKFRSL
ncbi:MAG: polysaccharide biosynthesis protein [Clostridia bacterium]|nr:polysaccharide biosynthesis protein [Clostridia bacterium]